MRGFDYRTATEEEILHRAALLEGMLLGDVPEARFSARQARRGKGEVGLAIEAYFGIPPNPVPGADFPGAGIELKVVPLVRSDRRLKVKERTVISLIDYDSILHETWKDGQRPEEVEDPLRLLRASPRPPEAGVPHP